MLYCISYKKSPPEVLFSMKYDVIIIGAGPGGIFSAFELIRKKP